MCFLKRINLFKNIENVDMIDLKLLRTLQKDAKLTAKAIGIV